MLGIDTYKHTHLAVVLDGLGRHQGSLQVPASDAEAAELLAWAGSHGSPQTAGVEGTGSYGYQLTRRLQGAGLTVVEVNRPDRANHRRKGKSDPVDADAAARAVLAGQATAVPKDRVVPHCWISIDDVDAGRNKGLTSNEHNELVELRRRTWVLEMENEIRKRASAYRARETVRRFMGRIGGSCGRELRGSG